MKKKRGKSTTLIKTMRNWNRKRTHLLMIAEPFWSNSFRKTQPQLTSASWPLLWTWNTTLWLKKVQIYYLSVVFCRKLIIMFITIQIYPLKSEPGIFRRRILNLWRMGQRDRFDVHPTWLKNNWSRGFRAFNAVFLTISRDPIGVNELVEGGGWTMRRLVTLLGCAFRLAMVQCCKGRLCVLISVFESLSAFYCLL